MNLTKQQDCHAIVAAFERGAHFNTDEASTYAPLTRHVQNVRSAARSNQKVLENYKTQPVSNTASKDDVTKSQTGVLLNTQYVPVPSDKSSTDILSRALKDCVPCGSRPIMSLDLSVGKHILDIMKNDVLSRLQFIDKIKDMFTNLNFYGDYCQMVSLLNFICIPDLQRILMLLASLLTDYGSGLQNLTAALQAIIAPLFYPVILSLNSVLDKLLQLVLNPMNCIITVVQENIRKLNIGTLVGDQTLTNASRNLTLVQNEANVELKMFQGQVRSAMVELYNRMNEGNISLRNKVDFYSQQLQKLLKQWGNHNINYSRIANDKLLVVRLIAFVSAMIKAKQNGQVCNGIKPAPSELDNFFGRYLSPNSPFNITVDKDGNLRLEEKINTKPIVGISVGSKPLLKAPIIPVTQTFTCNLNTSSTDINKVNTWIDQLNSTGVI